MDGHVTPKRPVPPSGTPSRKGQSGDAAAPARRATAPRLDEALFHAWQSGSADARDRAWTLLWSSIYSMAVAFCCRFAPDRSTGTQWATSAFGTALLEIEDLLKKREVAWQGPAALVAFVRTRVILRCRDECRGAVRWGRHFVDVEGSDDDGDGGEDRLAALATHGATPEDDLIRDQRNRDGLRRIVTELSALAELCRDRDALAEVVGEMRSYLWDRLAAALPPGTSALSLTLDQLADIARPEEVEATKSAMYRWIMERLRLERVTFDQRMRHVRTLIRHVLSGADR